MTTNGEWLEYLANNAPDELAAWFDAERITNQAEMLHMPESHESATMQHIGQVIESTVKRGVYGDTAAENEDSRERLEADVREWIDIATYKKFTPERMFEVMLHWIDRQAAITDAEWDDELEQLHMGYKPLIDGLQAQVDELTAERDNLKDELIDERGELNRQINTMRDVIRDYRNERDHYRSKFGKCLDYADAIHALMDEGIA